MPLTLDEELRALMPLTLDEELRAWDKCEGAARALNEGLTALLSATPPIVRDEAERARVRAMATEMRTIADLFDKLAGP
jgi:hypothetical protein